MELTEEHAPELQSRAARDVLGSILAVSFVPLKNNFEYDEDEVDDSADKEDSGGNAGSALLFSWAAAGAFMVAAAGLTAE